MKTRMLLLSVVLLLGLASSPLWGPLSHQVIAEAQEPKPSGQSRPAALDIPVDDLDRGTPRRAVEGFLQAAR